MKMIGNATKTAEIMIPPPLGVSTWSKAKQPDLVLRKTAVHDVGE
jgi:hypothetical protein